MLKDKAVENLAAGDLLLERGHINAAASRYYYAMYQAAVRSLTLLEFRPGGIRSGAVDWDHSMVENNVMQCRKEWRDRVLYMQLRRLRSRADYGDEPVLRVEIEERRDAIRQFVKEVASWTTRG